MRLANGLQPLKPFLFALFKSKTGYLFAIVHLLTVSYLFSLKPPLTQLQAEQQRTMLREGWTVGQIIAGRSYHLPDEHPVLKLIGTIDIVAIVASIIPILPFLPLINNASAIQESWYLAGALALTTSLQWMLIGYWVAEALMNRRSKAFQNMGSAP